MYKFDLEKGKILEFKTEFKNVDPKKLKAYFRICSEGVDYCIGGNINSKNNTVTFKIPPLKDIIQKNVKETMDVNIEFVGEEFYKSVVKDNISFKPTTKIELELVENATETSSNKSIKILAKEEFQFDDEDYEEDYEEEEYDDEEDIDFEEDEYQEESHQKDNIDKLLQELIR